MKRFIIALCVLYLVSIFALAQGTKDQAPQPDAKLAKELMAIHQQWLEARKRGDTETMARTLGDEWTITTYNGHIINKEQGLADAKTSNQKDRLIGTHDNLIARAYGNTAVLTYRSKTQDGYIQTIQVWVKRQGRWQRVASQSTKLAEQQPQ
jgi:hypothetical protein